MRSRCSIACIIPPVLLEELARRASDEERDALLRTLSLDASLRTARVHNSLTAARVNRATIRQSVTAGQPQRTIYDCQGLEPPSNPDQVRAEGDPPSEDVTVNEAYDGLGDTYAFFWDQFRRDSIDDEGMPLHGWVHYGFEYDNAFWDGEEMVFGDGEDVRPLHQVARRHRPRADPRRDRARGGPAVPQPVRRAQRVGLRRLRQPRQAVQARPGRRPGRLADRRRPRQARLPGQGAALDGRAGHRLGRRQPARAHGRLRADDERQRRRPHQLGHPQQGVRRAVAGAGRPAWEKAGRIWYETLRDPLVRGTRPSASSRAARRRRRGSSTAPAATRSTPSPRAWDGVGVSAL